jgi:UrcA family protein
MPKAFQFAVTVNVALFGMAIPAQSQTLGQEPIRVAISYADLNLATSQGRNRLDRRIYAAARKICGPADSSAERLRYRVKRCRQSIRSSAAADRAYAIQKAKAL